MNQISFVDVLKLKNEKNSTSQLKHLRHKYWKPAIEKT